MQEERSSYTFQLQKLERTVNTFVIAGPQKSTKNKDISFNFKLLCGIVKTNLMKGLPFRIHRMGCA